MTPSRQEFKREIRSRTFGIIRFVGTICFFLWIICMVYVCKKPLPYEEFKTMATCYLAVAACLMTVYLLASFIPSDYKFVILVQSNQIVFEYGEDNSFFAMGRDFQIKAEKKSLIVYNEYTRIILPRSKKIEEFLNDIKNQPEEGTN